MAQIDIDKMKLGPFSDSSLEAETIVELSLLSQNTHFLTGEIGEDNTKKAIQWLISENLNTDRKTLTLYINSTGGDLYDAFALIDVMKNSIHPIRTIGIGAVMSAAFLIFAAGTKGLRFAGPNTSFMCHQYSETLTGKHHDIKASIKECDTYNTRMVQLLQEASGLSSAKVKSRLLPASDVYLTADEVLEMNIADHIFSKKS
jgi:ATP-dependent Clp protease protease subunit